MSIIEWKKDFESGINCIDNQHRQLLDCLNGLIAAMNEGKGKSAVYGLVSFLDDYVINHFGTELKYMTEYEYPELESHLKEHRFFIDELAELKCQMAEDGPSSSLAMQVKRRLLDWYIKHITEVDTRLCTYLKERA